MRTVSAVLLALVLAACGVQPQHQPEPVPSGELPRSAQSPVTPEGSGSSTVSSTSSSWAKRSR